MEHLQLVCSSSVKYNLLTYWIRCVTKRWDSYACGAATNPDAHVVAFAAAQVKKGLEIGKKLGAGGFVFWGGREGYKYVMILNNLMPFIQLNNI